jgi:hypothetical protein
MFTTETSDNVQKSERNPGKNQAIPSEKIIDFFTAREALRSEIKSRDEQVELQQQIQAATKRKSRVHLSNPWEDAMLLLLLAATVGLGLLVISGFG